MAETTICKNPWCKVQISYDGEKPLYCKKCNSFNNDLSGGVSWSDRVYDGPRFDGVPHMININVKNYSDKK